MWLINWFKQHGRQSITDPETASDTEIATTESKRGVLSFLPFFGTNTKYSKEEITVDTSLKLSAVWACVLLRQRIISSMPIHLKNAEKINDTNSRLGKILHAIPNENQTAAVFYGLISARLDLYGNAFIFIKKDEKNSLISLTLLDNEKVKVKINENTGKKYFVVTVFENGKKEKVEYSTDDIVHIFSLSLNGYLGLSPIEYAAETIGDLQMLEKTYASAAKNGLKTIAVLKTNERQINENQKDTINDQFKEYARPENAGGVITLPIGRELQQSNFLSLTPQSAQLLESRYYGIEEICRAFGVPPILIGHTQKSAAWANSLENTNQQFLTYSINPTLIAIEQALEKALIVFDKEYQDYTIKFNRGVLLQADTKSRWEAYEKGLRNGVLSTNTVLDYEDMPKSTDKNADKLRCELNMTLLEKLGQSDE